ncbi:hypothetical protein JB92DRAFT_3140592 [Gautieria morchelliformis]|nr:hypothetical protein JB92DRAFT_3140592 [Gautieria morchelliformis]
MIDRPNESQFTPHSGLQQQTWAEREWLAEGDSRVSTDSDLDLESDNEDDYRSTFSNLLMRKLVAIELAQQHAFRKEKPAARVTPPQPNFAAEDSYCAKMRRVSQWRESTLPSEASSEAQSGASSSYSPPAASRKRSLSNASLPTDSKRARVTTLSPAPPGSPFFPPACASPADNTTDLSAYTRFIRTQPSTQPYPSQGALHVCSACDTSFSSRQRLRRHGSGVWTPDACRAAVTYGLE